MMVKKFEADSRYKQYDADGDGVVTDEELSRASEMIEIELREAVSYTHLTLPTSDLV